MNQAKLFFEAGADGGGEALYRNPDGTFFWLKCRHNPEHYYNQNDSRHRASGHDEETQFSD